MRTRKEENIQIGEQVKLAREMAKLTQEELAEHVGVTPQYISDLERGVVGIAIPTLKRMCTALSASSDRILFGSEVRDRGVVLAEKVGGLSEEQFLLLLKMVAIFVESCTIK